MTSTSGKTVAIVILTHFYNELIGQLYNRLCREVPAGYDVFVHINQRRGVTAPPKDTAVLGTALSLSSEDELIALGYPKKCAAIQADGLPWSLQGNNDLPMLYFWRNHPRYDQYWGIEYDVHYQGDWKRLFDHFANSKADLLSTSLHNAADVPDNRLDPEYRNPEGVNPAMADTVRGFYPLYRVTDRALSAIDAAYREGWSGHYEMGWANYVLRAGGTIEDIGGNGIYVKPENRNRFYFCMKSTFTKSPGTFVFRPSFSKVPAFENTLWHPVKPPGPDIDWFAQDSLGSGLKATLERIKPFVWGVVIRLWFILFWRRLA